MYYDVFLRSQAAPAHCFLPEAGEQRKLRCWLFATGIGGRAVAEAIARPPLAGRVEIVGVATDDDPPPGNSKRFAASFTSDERRLVPKFAAKHGLPLRRAHEVADPEFAREFAQAKVDLAIVCIFGRRIPQAVIEATPIVVNLHAGLPEPWPNCRGGRPYSEILQAGKRGEPRFVVFAHQVVDDHAFDTGPEVAVSQPIPFALNQTERELYLLSIAARVALAEEICTALVAGEVVAPVAVTAAGNSTP